MVVITRVDKAEAVPLTGTYCLISLSIFFETCSLLIQDALSDVRQFLTTNSPLKMIKNALHFILNALFALKVY